MDTLDYATEAELFDYSSTAELFSGKSRKLRRQPLGYRRFARVADALRFAMEDLPPEALLGSYLEIEEQRFDSHGMRRLYESAAYPLARRAAGPSQ
jgi:hypothetical protein